MRKTNIILIILMVVLAGLLITGCGYQGDIDTNQKPIINLYNNPADGDTLGAAPIMYWQAFDTDGKVYVYEYIILPHQQAGKGLATSIWNQYYENQQSLADVESLVTLDNMKIRWTRVDSSSTSDTIFFQHLHPDSVTKHLFCVRGKDNENLYSDIVCRTFYRNNLPPDSCVIVTDPFDGEEFWILKDTTYSWKGIEVSWTGGDPDHSILLEYRWQLEQVSTGNVVITSLVDDSIGGINSGYDPTDGWVRSTTTYLKGEIPENGDYRFWVQVRDDAFYPGAADTAVITLAQPVFDISDPTVRQQYINGTFVHKVLIIDQNNSVGYPDFAIVSAWYDGVFDNLVSSNVIRDYEIIRPASASTWSIPRTTLADYSIIWVLDQEYFSTTMKIGSEYLLELMNYIQVGGRLVFDGRDMFKNELDGWSQSPSYNYFGIAEDVEGSGNKIFARAVANTSISGFPDLYVDPAKTVDGLSIINRVTRIGMREPSFSGSPYTQRVYSFGIVDTASADDKRDFENVPVAVRFVTPSFRSAYFGFPLYLMNNDEGQVEQVIENTLQFIKTQLDVQPDSLDIPL